MLPKQQLYKVTSLKSGTYAGTPNFCKNYHRRDIYMARYRTASTHVSTPCKPTAVWETDETLM